MKLLVVLSLIACGYAAKLDRTYLPPASASTAGGSPGSLNAPPSASGPSGSAFGQGSPIQSNTAFGNAYQAPSSQYNQPAGSNIDSGFGQPAFGNQGQSFGNQAQDYQRNQPERARASEDRNAQILRSDSQNDGETFSYSFETSNGISAEESGVATNGVQAQGAFSYSDDDGQSYRVVYTADENGYQPQGDHLPTPHPIPEDILKSIEQNARAAAAGTQEGAYNPEEDNAPAFAPQQYNNNAPTSYGQASAGQSAAYNQPGQAPELYAAPNAATPARSQGNAQPSQLYGAPSGSPSRPSGPSAFKQTQAPAQQYNAPTANARPNTYSQNQAPSGPSNNFAPSGSSFGSSANQGRPSQYQASPSSQFGRPQALSVQAQDESGYQYNRPQAAFGRGSNNASPSQGQFNSQNGAQGSRPQGFGAPAPARSQGFGAASGQGSYGPAAGARPQSFAPSAGPRFQGSPAPKGKFGAQPSFGSPAATPSFGAAPSGSSFGPSNGQNFGKSQGMTDSGYQYNRPQAGNQRPQGGFNGAQVGLRPQAGSNGSQGSAGAQNGFKAGPQQGGQSFEGPRQPPSFSEEEGYKY